VFHSTISELMDISISREPAGRVQINRRTGIPKVSGFHCLILGSD